MTEKFQAVILAAGEGKRFTASGGNVLKQVVPYHGVPVIRRLANQAIATPQISGVTVVLGPNQSDAQMIKEALEGCDITYVTNVDARRDNNLLSFYAGTKNLKIGALIIEADCIVSDSDLGNMTTATSPDQICWANIGPAADYDYGGLIKLSADGQVTNIEVLDADAYGQFKATGAGGVKLFGLTAFGINALTTYIQYLDELTESYGKYFHLIASKYPEEFNFCTIEMSEKVFSFNVVAELKGE